MRPVLLLAGRQGSGKTSNATMIGRACEDLGYIVHHLKFADPLYSLHAACLPILKEYGVRPETMAKDGELLQVLGTEYGRKHLGESVWIDVCQRRVDKILEAKSENDLIIIDDLRFENEFDVFPNAYKVHLECAREVRKSRASYWRENEGHASEKGLDDYILKGKFDLRVNTEHASKESVSHVIRVEWFNDKSFAIKGEVK